MKIRDLKPASLYIPPRTCDTTSATATTPTPASTGLSPGKAKLPDASVVATLNQLQVLGAENMVQFDGTWVATIIASQKIH